MSIHFGAVATIIGAVAGLILANTLGVGQHAAAGLAVAGGLAATVVALKSSDGSLAWGFGARRGPGASMEDLKEDGGSR